MSKKGNSTWINLDDLRSLFSKEEIEARKKEISEEMELKRKKDFEAKELMKQARKEHADKGWNSSSIGQELRLNPDVEGILEEVMDQVIPKEEPEIDPKEEEIIKLKEQLAALEAIKELDKDEDAEILENHGEESGQKG